jgi:ribosomal protein L7/L12
MPQQLVMRNGVKFIKAEIQVQVGPATFAPKLHHVRFLREVYSTNVIAGVRFIRTEYGLGLKEAKDFCDAVRDLHGSPDDPFAGLC